jgi:hypothetical protein
MKTALILLLLATPLLAADQVIVYEVDGGRVHIVSPTDNSGLSIGQVESKDVPRGVRRKVISVDLIPPRQRRDEWTFSNSREDGITRPEAVNPAPRVR